MDRSQLVAELVEELRTFRARKSATDLIDDGSYPRICEALGEDDAYETTGALRAILMRERDQDRFRQSAFWTLFGTGDNVQDRLQLAADIDFVDTRTARRHSDAGLDILATELADLRILNRTITEVFHELSVVPLDDDMILIDLKTNTQAGKFGSIVWGINRDIEAGEGWVEEYQHQREGIDEGWLLGVWQKQIPLSDFEGKAIDVTVIPASRVRPIVFVAAPLHHGAYSIRTMVRAPLMMVQFIPVRK